jgi:pimeloyl-ACP methyl ester carboxylesterase
MDFAPHKKFVATSKGSICYFVAGPETSTQTVMLLHGLSSNHTTWLTFMETLATFGIRSIAPDLRGHGFSEKSKQKTWYTFPVFAEDIHRIADEEHLQKFDVVGYSFGGYIALAYAAEHPETLRSLSLVSANFMNPLHYGPFSPFAPALATFLDGAAWLSRPQGHEPYHYFEHGRSTGYLNSTFKGLFTMPFSLNFWMLAETLRLNLAPALPRITCPTLIVRSASDPYLTEREVMDMAHAIKNARTVTIAGEGHFLASQNQAALAEQLIPFIQHP